MAPEFLELTGVGLVSGEPGRPRPQRLGLNDPFHRTGQPIGRADPMIAATAIASDLVVVTGNTGHDELLGSAIRSRSRTGALALRRSDNRIWDHQANSKLDKRLGLADQLVERRLAALGGG